MVPLGLFAPAPAPLAFDFKDPKEISAVSLTLDSPLEPIVGYAKGISGSVFFDPKRPERATGKIAVDVSSVRFANDGYSATARGYALNEKKWPQILLTIRKVQSVKRVSKTRFSGIVLADFTCRGVTKPKRLVVTADYYPGRAEERTGGKQKGDLLILRTRFAVSRREHGMSEGIPDELVGDQIEVGVAVVGTHVAIPKAATMWEIEVAHRDDPVLVQAVRTGDRLSFGPLGATITSEKGDTLAFRLDPNPGYGEATGRIDADGSGILHQNDGDLALRGRRVKAFTKRPSLAPTGSGLAELDLPRRMTEAGTPGMAVVRILDDRIAETALYGFRRAGGTVPVDADTLFQAGTMGLPLLHLATVRLAVAGRIDLGKSVDAYLGDAGIGDARVTVRDLLRGTSGFPHAKFAGFRPSLLAPTLRAAIGSPKAEPGKETVSATNEAFLELVIEKATGLRAAAVVAEQVFKPCGMVASNYAPHPPQAASGHYQSGDPTLDPFHAYSLESGLWTTAGDFARLLVETNKLIGGRPNALIAPDDPLLKSLETIKSILGIRKDEDGGLYLGGDPYGFFCEFFIRPAEGEGVLVLQNRMMAWKLTNEVAEAIRRGR